MKPFMRDQGTPRAESTSVDTTALHPPDPQLQAPQAPLAEEEWPIPQPPPRPLAVDQKAVEQSLELLHRPGETFEIRALEVSEAKLNGRIDHRTQSTLFGYFQNAKEAAKQLIYALGLAFFSGIYVTLNSIDPSLHARAADRLKFAGRKDSVTADGDITLLRWLLVDLDYGRAANISTTDEEHEAALALAQTIRTGLTTRGWPEPVFCDSGNGAHLLYRVELRPEDSTLIKNVLASLQNEFGGGKVKVDQTVHNPSRITKLYGTLACKGDNTPVRPHRLSRILEVPTELSAVPRELLEEYARRSAPAPLPAARTPKANSSSTGKGRATRRDLGSFAEGHINLDTLVKEKWPDAIKKIKDDGRVIYDLNPCPWNPEHLSGAYVGQFDSGGYFAGCHHDSCKEKEWADFKETLGLEAPSQGPYRELDGRIWYRRVTQEGVQWIPITNFTAFIVREIFYDDGAEGASRSFVIEGALRDGASLPPTTVSAAEFPKVNQWSLRSWGARARVSAAQGSVDRIREAIQTLSAGYSVSTIYQHTGWRKIDGEWQFLHADGAITAKGLVKSVEVGLEGRFQKYALPRPPSGLELIALVRSVVTTFRAVGPDRVTLPLLAGVFRAALTEIMGVQEAIYIQGGTGTGKSTLSGIAQAFYGPGFAGRGTDPVFPGSWSSSENALEAEAFRAKDVLFIIDDWVVDTHSTRDSLYRKASRVLRDAANSAGRATLKADRTARQVYRCRGLLGTTAEDLPPGQSLRARLVCLDLEPGDIGVSDKDPARRKALSDAQRAARDGENASVTSAYVCWLAPKLDGLKKGLPHREREVLDGLAIESSHAKVRSALASLITGFEVFLEFCSDVGALSDDETRSLRSDLVTALTEVAGRQESLLAAADPVDRFWQLLNAVLLTGRGHLLHKGTERIMKSPSYGWRTRPGSEVWEPQGGLLGWVDANAGVWLLEPEATFAAISRLASEQNHPFPLSAQRLWTALSERKQIVDREEPRFTVRVKIGDGPRRRVLKVRPRTGGEGPTTGADEVGET